ncbi:type I 3-dehydroquinate dehydratase [Candidatus Peregrinibacteria bacterium]|nr:type I 3-dehydroquinate dehydratase [Candidatus Peregrinibacteria bacterium]
MLCAPIKKRDLKEVLRMIKSVPDEFDLIEIWIDEIKAIKADYKKIVEEICRTSKKMLLFKFTKNPGCARNAQANWYFALLKICTSALFAEKIKYFDFAFDEEGNYSLIKEILTNRTNGRKLIFSYHNDSFTPLYSDLLEIVQKMKQKGADIIKIVTKAVKIEDNLVPLKLLANAAVIGVMAIAFCSGDKGRMSRMWAGEFGSYMDYVLPSEKFRTAEGQILWDEWRKVNVSLSA